MQKEFTLAAKGKRHYLSKEQLINACALKWTTTRWKSLKISVSLSPLKVSKKLIYWIEYLIFSKDYRNIERNFFGDFTRLNTQVWAKKEHN